MTGGAVLKSMPRCRTNTDERHGAHSSAGGSAQSIGEAAEIGGEKGEGASEAAEEGRFLAERWVLRVNRRGSWGRRALQSTEITYPAKLGSGLTTSS